ncbi:MAG: tRNA-binding protein [Arenicellales bacterium]
MTDETISWDDFERVKLCVGTIIRVEDFPEAHKPAYKVTVDFGPEIGELKTSARIADLYTKEELQGRQILGVVNFPTKQIGPVRSQFLLTGFHQEDGHVVIAVPERKVPNGARLA